MLIIELLLAGLALLALTSIVWSTVRTGIPPMMSNRPARQGMLSLIGDHQAGAIVDLGCAWGTLVVAAAQRYPNRQVIGYEVSWLPWLVASLRVRWHRQTNARVYRKDFRHHVRKDGDTLLCYLMPTGMQALAQELAAQPCQQTVISNNFTLPGHQPNQRIIVADVYRSPIYRYHLS